MFVEVRERIEAIGTRLQIELALFGRARPRRARYTRPARRSQSRPRSRRAARGAAGRVRLRDRPEAVSKPCAWARSTAAAGSGSASCRHVRPSRSSPPSASAFARSVCSRCSMLASRGTDAARTASCIAVRVHVVGRLRRVDVIVGMHRAVPTDRRIEQLIRTVRDHLVGVHVRRRATAALRRARVGRRRRAHPRRPPARPERWRQRAPARAHRARRWFVQAAALTWPSPAISVGWLARVTPETAKFARARAVWIPHSASRGTLSSPRASRSSLVSSPATAGEL